MSQVKQLHSDLEDSMTREQSYHRISHQQLNVANPLLPDHSRAIEGDSQSRPDTYEDAGSVASSAAQQQLSHLVYQQ